MIERVELSRSCRRLDLFGAGQQQAGARFEAEPVERIAFECRGDARGQVVGDHEFRALECAGERAAQALLRDRFVQFGAGDADPRAAAGGLGTHVGQHLSVRRDRESHEVVADVAVLRQNAFADGVGHAATSARPTPSFPRRRESRRATANDEIARSASLDPRLGSHRSNTSMGALRGDDG
ncbi:hypothetical protein WR25_14183 [Diploscapter pachys]|uniref:Uncharacterized protein n=1 Tax=Diploscapter pachys TaxID=2018661 RepID=A0A2A2M3Y5_9BILA|nr:hypothetical protein WR25_14183 [Diploscapter pachys]